MPHLQPTRRWVQAATLSALLGAAVLAGPSAQAEPPVISMEAVYNDPVAPEIAPAGHDVTVILFSDYRCPYCRRFHATLMQLLAEDPKVRVVFRDWPILSEQSVRAARLAIASKWQGRHAAFNNALLQPDADLSEDGLREAADAAGVDWGQLEKDLAAHAGEIDALLDRTRQQAPALGLQGTPAVLIGTYLVPGAVDLGQLKEIVAAARAEARPAP